MINNNNHNNNEPISITAYLAPDPVTKLQLRLPASLKSTLDVAASQRRISSSLLIRLAITSYLGLSANQAQFKTPITRQEKESRANNKRKLANKALRYLAKHEPLKFAAIVQEVTTK